MPPEVVHSRTIHLSDKAAAIFAEYCKKDSNEVDPAELEVIFTEFEKAARETITTTESTHPEKPDRNRRVCMFSPLSRKKSHTSVEDLFGKPGPGCS